LLATVIQQNFSGIDSNETSCGCTPPDTQMAVGPSSVISGVNSAFSILNKTGGTIAAPVEGNVFFASVLKPGQKYRGDPQTIYDDQSNRFYVAGFELNTTFTTGSLDLAVSKTSNPLTLTATDWFFYRFDSVGEAGTQFPDFPKIGFNKDAIFVSFNQFAGGVSFSHNLILTIDKASVLSGGVATSFTTNVATTSGTRILIPARMHNHTTGNVGIFVQKDSNVTDTVNIIKMTNYLSASPIFTTTTITVNPYDQSPGVPGLTNQIDDRMLSASWINDKLVASKNIGLGGLNLARWYQFNAPLAGAPTLVQQGDISPGPGINTSYPSIAINPAGDIALTYMQNSSTQGTSMYVTGRSAALTLGFLSPGRLVIAGAGLTSAFRGGDYSATEYDPSNPSSFWSANQYQLPNTNSNFDWGTQIAKYTITPAPTVIGSTPTDSQTTAVSSVIFNFDQPMNVGSFSIGADVVSFTGPSGDLKPLISSSSFNGAGTALTINFASQAIVGNYSFVLGPQILSAAGGFALDNNLNGTAGEIPGDNFNGTFSILNLTCESFDNVTAPALPAGWSSQSSVGTASWVTSTTTSLSLPNNAFVPGVGSASDTRLIGPSFTYTSTNKEVQFQQNYDFETNFDGGVLEISINGGAFQDIIAAGGSFIAGGYNRTITVSNNPLSGRQGWSGRSNGYILTRVNLPEESVGLPVRLQWRQGTDEIIAHSGWHIDDVCVPTPPSLQTTLAISATSANKAEGNIASNPFTFTVTRSGNISGATTVNYAVTGTGVNPANSADFFGLLLPSGTVSFAANETSKAVSIGVAGDMIVELDETFNVTLSAGTGNAIISTASAIGTIRNDDTSLVIAATSADKAEGNAGENAFTFTVTRSGVVSGAATVNFAITGNGASPANAADFIGFVLPSGTLSFAANETTKIISVRVNGDTTVEADDSFLVTLSSAIGAIITTSTAFGAIRNDDASATTLGIVATSADKAEGNAGGVPYTFTLTRSGNVSVATTVNFAVTGSGANPAGPSDFVGGILPSGSVSFAATETFKVISVNVIGDIAVETDETFLVTLSGASGGASITTSTATGTIRNDDAALSIIATSANKAEGNFGSTPFTFTVTRSGFITGAATANFIVTGSGVNPVNIMDFSGTIQPSGIVSFAANETSKVITINVNGDIGVEPDETFLVTLSAASNGVTIISNAATGTIRNDDSSFAIAATSADKAEGNSGPTPFTFTVTRSGNTSEIATINFVASGSGVAPANATDFSGGVLPSGSITFNANETSKLITINVSGDATVEQAETFQVALANTNSSNFVMAGPATGTIRNDDAAPTTLAIAALSANKAEGSIGATPFTFTVTRSGDTTITTTVNFAVSGTGATPASAADFTGGAFPSGTVAFNANETSKVVTINVNGDATVEPDETFLVALSGASGGAIVTTSSAMGRIVNDDTVAGLMSLSCGALHVGSNICTVTGATPGGVVMFAKGTMAGPTPLPTFGLTLGIANPTYFAQGFVNASGQATVVLNLLASQVGQPILVQAIQQAPTPRLSTLVSQTVAAAAVGPAITVQGPAGQNANAASLDANDLAPILKIAIEYWKASGVTAAELQLLNQVKLQIADLSGRSLGQSSGTTITLDANAADNGWFVDSTPRDSSEFRRQRTQPGQPFSQRQLTAREDGPADKLVDLLTVVLHEMANVLRRQQSSTSPIPLLNTELAVSVRRLPPNVVDTIFAQA